jgi:hypothetical protein
MLLDAVPVEHALVYFSGLARGTGRAVAAGRFESSNLRIEISGFKSEKTQTLYVLDFI